MNQCDGCRQKIPIKNGMHYDEKDFPIWLCTAHLYPKEPSWFMNKLASLGAGLLVMISLFKKSGHKEGEGIQCEGCPHGTAFYKHKVTSHGLRQLCTGCLRREALERIEEEENRG